LHIRQLLTCILFTCLTGCLYHGDIHSHTKAITINELNTHHIYQAQPTPPHTQAWWEQFHDATLNQLITTALASSPTMQTAQARIRRAQALTQAAGSLLLPTVDFSGYLQRQRFSQFGLVPPPFNGKTFNIGELGLNFNYDFDFWGKNREILAARISETCAAEADLAQSRLIISSAVAAAYFNLLNNIALEHLAKQNLIVTKDISQIVLYRAKHGIDSDIPLKTALANTSSAQLNLDQLKQAEMLSRNQLAVLMGKNPFTTDIITPRFIYHHYTVTLPKPLTANLLAKRPDIYAAKLRAEAASHQVNVSQTRFFPDMNLNGLLSYQSINIGKLLAPGSQNNAITGAVDLPIFDAETRRADLAVKYAEYDIAVNNYNQTLLTALKDVADQLATIKSVKSQLFAQTQALQATTHNYQLFKSRYHHGIVDYVQVLELKQLLLQNQSTELNLQTRHLQAVVALIKALGGNEGQSA